MTKQNVEELKIRSVSDRLRPVGNMPGESRRSEAKAPGSALGLMAPAQMFTKQMAERPKIRSVSDGSAWGWGPTRIKK